MGKDKKYPELVSPFLRKKMGMLKEKYGLESKEYQGLARQYLLDPGETEVDYKTERRRHYEADLLQDADGSGLKGVERLYRRVVVFELTTACVSHCRWCLRANYPKFTLTEEDITRVTKHFGDAKNRDDLREILITGGDPFVVPDLLNFTIDSIQKFAPNIQIVRIGTRLPVQDPKRIYEPKLQNALRKRSGLRVEVGTQVNHPLELFPESKEAFKVLQDMGIHIYNQQVLLKRVNNDVDILAELYDGLREVGIEAHYMFHCCPIHGMNHHRTSVEEGLELIKRLTSSGKISGRCKPMYTAMTDIGKVTLYEGVILEKRGDMILLQTRYKKEERLKWNPSWKIPDSAEVDSGRYLKVWYKDGKTHKETWPSTYLFNE